ncbi:O-antigen ligase [Acidipila sp. EB88]|uniref:O-antigen ligase family protein n=1 Tax=Acidipila sp. EB88 TaxID=2305226 RepID=UPI000F5DF143|nr:O-antigen ligase family protein [Acidipila sp. EB88]RRA49058.1 hypothetical protein D1Y84_12985 [Acidipila sp. EB88]
MSTHAPTATMPDRRLIIALSMIPTMDCFTNQLNNALDLRFGPVSFLQLLRGPLLLVFLFLIARHLKRQVGTRTAVPFAALGAVALVAIATSKEILLTGTLSLESVASYGQLVYWLVLWTLVSLLIRSRAQAELLLKGVAAGGVLTALSVFAGLVAGAGNYYSSDAVDASAGWFDTAKMITGILVVSGIVILYLGRARRSWLHPLAAMLCFAACVLTYARAGMAALGAALLWLTFWRFFLAPAGTGRWLTRLLALMLGALLLVPAVVDTHQLLARWSDLGDSDKAGSGRATFWKLAVNAYEDDDLAGQALGNGYHAMSTMLFHEYGDDIKHTHNDLFDMLLVGGLVGAMWLLTLVGSFVRQSLLAPVRTATAAASIAILLAYLCHGQLTGQIWGTDAMTCYTFALLGITRPAERRQARRAAGGALTARATPAMETHPGEPDEQFA